MYHDAPPSGASRPTATATSRRDDQRPLIKKSTQKRRSRLYPTPLLGYEGEFRRGVATPRSVHAGPGRAASLLQDPNPHGTDLPDQPPFQDLVLGPRAQPPPARQEGEH